MKLKSLFFPLLLLSLITRAQIPSGYYNAATGLTGAPLKTALYIIIKNHTSLSYDALWTAFQTTDKKTDGKVWDMYSNCSFTFGSDQCGSYSVECDCYNREHSFPQSWFNSNSPMVSDLFHIYPTDGKVNGMRSNYPYGTVGTATYTSGNGSRLGASITAGYTSIVFEPIDEYKGDFARGYFYMATRYENMIASWQSNTGADEVLNGTAYPCYDPWFLNLLFAWSNADPVSPKEIDRNNAIYTSFQHNRNPYIDHPEYINAVWNLGASPALTALPVSLSNFTYASGSGSSASQSYILSGTALVPASGNITITGSADFEVSTNNSTFGTSALIAYSASALAATTIFVRLKSGLGSGTYNNELIANSGGGAPTANIVCSGSVSTAVLPEPTNYPGNFSAHNIQLHWTDATGTTAPTNYLIRMSTLGFSSISSPVDGTTYANTATDLNVPYGQQNAWFKNLNANTTYYFKLFGYSGSGFESNYKTDGLVPQIQQITAP
jgi:endonuclease I